MGVDPKELFFVDYNNFKNSNPELHLLNKELQKMRFDHFEKLRLSTITKLKEERANLMNEAVSGDSKFSYQSKTSSRNLIIDPERIKSIKEAERKQIEKIKLRQKMEIQTLIESEINQEVIRMENEEKQQKQKMKEEQMKLELMKKQKEQEE